MANKQVFFSISLDTKQPIANIGELKTLIKNLKKDLDQKNVLDVDFEPLKAKLKLAQTELAKFNDQVKSAPSFTQRMAGAFTESFKQIGSGFLALFAVDKVIAFGQQCVQSFSEAELSAQKLSTAVKINGGLAEDFEILQQQAEELQKKTIFSDDAIEQAQTLALQFGLTTEQVRKLIPSIVDYASATNQELIPALEGILKGTDGSARALKAYGINLVDTGSKAQNLADITDQLNLKFQGQAEQIASETTYGQLQKLGNQYDELKEKVGGFLAGFANAGATIANFVLNGFQPLEDGFDNVGDSIKGASKELKAFQDGFLQFRITSLEEQISQLGKLGQSTGELEKQLKGLKQQKLEFEISKKTDGEIIKLKENLEELKKAISGDKTGIAELKFNNAGGQKELDLINDQLKKRNLASILADKELTRLSTDELLKRRAEFLKINSIDADDQISAIDKVLKRREEESKKAIDIAKQQLSEEERLRKESFDKQQQLNKASADQSGKLQSEALKKYEQEQIQILTASYKSKGDFSKEAENKLAQDILQIKIDALEKEKLLYEDDPIKQAEISNKILAYKTEQANKELDLAKLTAEQKKAIDDTAEKTKVDQVKATNDYILEQSAQLINQLVAMDLEASRIRSQARINDINETLNAELSAIDIQQQKEEGTYVAQTATQKKFDAQRKAAKEKAAKEEAKIKTDQFKKDKAAAIISAIINTALAVIKAAGNIPLQIAIAAFGAIQLGVIAAQPVPQFKEGVVDFVGKGTETSDSNLVKISKGESVIPASATRKYKPFLENIVSEARDGNPLFGKAAVNLSSTVPAFANGYIPNSSTNSLNLTPSVQVDMSSIREMMAEQRSFFAAELSKERRAYVSERDITTTQNRNRKIENRSLFEAA